jgi:hypothetical protein
MAKNLINYLMHKILYNVITQALSHKEFIQCIKRIVGTSHSATGAIESALKYESPDAHCIARRLETAGGKRIKMRPLSADDTESGLR